MPEKDTPLDLQLFDHYKELIESLEISPQDVPGYKQMAYEWCVSEPTARRARTLLMAEGALPRAARTFKPIPHLTEVQQAHFWSRVGLPDENGCLKWMGGGNGKGYGQLRLNKILQRAHRVAWTFLVGPIPAGLTLDHVYERGCRSTLCVNVNHLEPVTDEENLRRQAEVSRG